MSPPPASISSLLTAARQLGVEKREAEMLLAHTLNQSRASLIAHPEWSVNAAQTQALLDQLHRRAAGEPLAYILGTREFYGEQFEVNRDVLIPRPETELLVEQALARILEHDSPNAATILDLGTGSGIIAITLARLHPTARVSAADFSTAALAVAQRNAQRHGVTIALVESDWLSAFAGQRFDLIVSNPPYIADQDPHLTQGDLRFEPQQALTDGMPGAKGLAALETIIQQAPAHLHSGGWLLLEHGYDQAEAVRARLTQHSFTMVSTAPDLAGIPRITSGQLR